MNIFVSYRSVNRALVEELVTDLESMGHSVWFDKHLEGGQKWWDNILQQIQQCDLLVFALTPQSVDSYPCQLEYTYANALKRHILPVLLVEGVKITLLPVVLQERQIVDYTRRDKAAFIALSKALAECPPAPALPHPLPKAPDAPISPMAALKTQIDAPTLTFEQQTALLYQLKNYLPNPEYSNEARALLERLSNHPSLLAAILRDIQIILNEPPVETTKSSPSSAPTRVLNSPDVLGDLMRKDSEAIWARIAPQPGETEYKPIYLPSASFKLPNWVKLRDGEKAVRTYNQLSTKGSFATFNQSASPLIVTNQRLLFHILNRSLIALELKDIVIMEKATVNVINPALRLQTRNNEQYFMILYATPFTYENREEFIALIEQLRAAL